MFSIVAGKYELKALLNIIGNLEERQVNHRNFVISEPEIIDKCTKEFSEMEKYLSTIESYIFPY